MGWGRTLTFMPWGSLFKLHRRLFQASFTPTAIRVYQPIQVSEARLAALRIIQSPAQWHEVLLLMTTSIIFRIAFGTPVESNSSPYCAMSRAANQATSNGGIAGATIVDLFPFVRFLPTWLVPFTAALRHARDSRPAIQRIHDVPWEASLPRILNGTAPPSFMRTHYERWATQHCPSAQDNAGQEKSNTRATTYPTGAKEGHTAASLDDIKGATGAVFIAGGNSTNSTVLTCLLFLTKYQAAQGEIIRELDEVLASSHAEQNEKGDGSCLLPDFDTLARLPRLTNFMNEVLRVLPLNPLVIPHASIAEDTYKGYRIPAGTSVFANVSAINNDPATYKNPEAFDPSRFTRGEPYPVANFGFGRRKCPGRDLALASVAMFLATVLSICEIKMVKGEDGRPKEPKAGVTIGLGG